MIDLKDPCCHECKLKVGGIETSQCELDPYDYVCHLRPQSSMSMLVGCILVVGTLVAAGPQIQKLFEVKSPEGISVVWIVMALYSDWCLIESIFMNQFQQLMACRNAFEECWGNFFTLYQSLIIFVGHFIVFCQILYYEGRLIKLRSHMAVSRRAHVFHVLNLFLFIVFVICGSVAGIIPAFKVGSCNAIFGGAVFGFNTASAIISVFQWLPQLITTYKTRSAGALSLLALLIQAPGVAISLTFLIMAGTKWYVWISMLTILCFLITLICMLVYFQFAAKFKAKRTANDLAKEGMIVANQT